MENPPARLAPLILLVEAVPRTTFLQIISWKFHMSFVSTTLHKIKKKTSYPASCIQKILL